MIGTICKFYVDIVHAVHWERGTVLCAPDHFSFSTFSNVVLTLWIWLHCREHLIYQYILLFWSLDLLLDTILSPSPISISFNLTAFGFSSGVLCQLWDLVQTSVFLNHVHPLKFTGGVQSRCRNMSGTINRNGWHIVAKWWVCMLLQFPPLL